jgi:predicted nucleic acid-binding protein
MFVLDTNVISELMRGPPNRRVADWISVRPASALFTTTICVAEILYGIAILPRGKRQRTIEAAAERMFVEDFEARVLPFDTAAARIFALMAADRRRLGRPIAHADAQIAAITLSRGGVLATRNTADFADTGVAVVDPWTAK